MPAPRRTVLVVEDNPDHALLVQLATSRVDAELSVEVVEDGEEAVAYLRGDGAFADRGAHPFPDLVILDLLMPRLDGFGVLQWLQDHPALARVPVVVFTSSISPLDETRAMRLGAAAFHTKPADLERLGVQVREIVTRWLG